MSKVDIHKFSFSELTSNSCGKTSMSLCMAPIIILTGCAVGIISAVNSDSNTILHGVAYTTIGAGLLGIRRFSKDKEVVDDTKKQDAVQ